MKALLHLHLYHILSDDVDVEATLGHPAAEKLAVKAFIERLHLHRNNHPDQSDG